MKESFQKRLFKENPTCFTVKTECWQQDQSNQYWGCISNEVWGSHSSLGKG